MPKLNKVIIGGIAAVVFVLSGIYILLDWYPQYQEQRETRNVFNNLLKSETEYNRAVFKALSEDTYGGKTPEETLKLFVEALRQENIELASKYFVLNTDMEAFGTEEFLSRGKWEEALVKARNERRLNTIADSVLKAKPSTRKRISEQEVQYIIVGQDNVVETTIYLELNPISNVWKIESI